MPGLAAFGQLTSQTCTRWLSISAFVPSPGYGGGYDGEPDCTNAERRNGGISRMGANYNPRTMEFGVRRSAFGVLVLVLGSVVLGSAVLVPGSAATRSA